MTVSHNYTNRDIMVMVFMIVVVKQAIIENKQTNGICYDVIVATTTTKAALFVWISLMHVALGPAYLEDSGFSVREELLTHN